jgi:hypothetical protein
MLSGMNSNTEVGAAKLGVGAGGRRVNLVRLAESQRVLIWFILGQIVLMGVIMAMGGWQGGGSTLGSTPPIVPMISGLLYFALLIAGLVLVVRMARAYGYNWFMSIAGGVLSLMSCLGLLFLVALNQRIISTLKAAGVQVGFMGVSPAEMNKLRTGVCAGCGYDIRGLTMPVCPECGRVLPLDRQSAHAGG